MRKLLVTIIFITMLGLFRSQAQCNLSNIVVNLNSASPSGPGCLVDMDIAFDMQENAGNKYIWLNLWKSTDYSFVTFNYGAGGAKGPKLNEMDGADHTHPPVAVIGIDNNTVPIVFLTSYAPDPTNITPRTGTTITKTTSGGLDHFVLSHVTFTVPGGCNSLVIQGDVWSTQANSANSAIHCYSQGISFFGDPTINGQVKCENPHQVQVLLNSVSTAPLTVNYTVYIDKGTVGIKDPGDPVAITNSGNFTLSAGTPYNSGFLNYLGNDVQPDANYPLLIELTVVSPFSKVTYGDLLNSCIPLPVNFKSFTAIRNRNNVNLKWETIFEQNSKGFYIEKNIGNNWEQVAYISSQASNSNSADLLTYSYTDLNNAKGITQYRIKQIDIDYRARYSEIRSVRAEGQTIKTVIYPNPTNDGSVNIVFDEVNAFRDVLLMDMSGRTIRQWKRVTNNNLQIENLNSGVYSLRIFNSETGEQTIEKIVVNKN